MAIKNNTVLDLPKKTKKTSISFKKSKISSLNNKEFNEEYQELFDFATVGHFILDINGNIVNANAFGIKLLGYTKKQIFGKALSDFFVSQISRDAFKPQLSKLLKTELPIYCACEIKQSNGEVFYAQIGTSYFKKQNKDFKYLISTITDITEKKIENNKLLDAYNKEKELNHLKSQFIAIASHEFRTPLSTILTSAELIEQYKHPKDEEKKKNHFRKIKASVHRIKEVLMDFLSAGEIEKGKISNNPVRFNLVEFIENLIVEVTPFDGIHNIKYTHKGEYLNVHLDKKLLTTCFTNLMINAFKYAPNGGIVHVTSKQSVSGKVEISIQDYGIGISEEDQSNIFTQFFRAKNASGMQGTGLGLNITKELISIMGGTISFKSKLNSGTIFTIKLPK